VTPADVGFVGLRSLDAPTGEASWWRASRWKTSIELMRIEDEWSKFWFTDQPSHLTYDRINGKLE
jgi:hypothetical protein